MDMTMYDIVDGELTILKEVKDTNCISINRFDWSDTSFYLTINDNRSGYDRITITFLGNDNEDLGFWCGAYYYSIKIDNRVYYIKYHVGKVELVDLHEDTIRIVTMKHNNALEKLSLEKIKDIIAIDGARGIWNKIDDILRHIR